MRTAVFAALLLFSHAAWAQAPAPKAKAPEPANRDGAVMKALQGSAPLTPAEVAALGPNADLVFIDVMRDPKSAPGLRARAVDGLAASGSALARDHLVRVAMATGEVDVPVLRRALLGLGWLRDGRAPEVIGPWLEHTSPQVRTDAAAALALTKTEAAIELLGRHNRSEKDATVRKHIERLLKQLRQELPPEPSRRKDQPRVLPPPPVEGRRF